MSTLDENIREARAWLLDCSYPAAALQGLSDQTVLNTVHRNYEGGLTEFIQSDPTNDLIRITTDVAERFSLQFALHVFTLR